MVTNKISRLIMALTIAMSLTVLTAMDLRGPVQAPVAGRAADNTGIAIKKVARGPVDDVGIAIKKVARAPVDDVGLAIKKVA